MANINRQVKLPDGSTQTVLVPEEWGKEEIRAALAKKMPDMFSQEKAGAPELDRPKKAGAPELDRPTLDEVKGRGTLARPADAKPVETSLFEGAMDFFTDVTNRMAVKGGVTRDAFTTLVRQREFTPTFDEGGELVGLNPETDEEYSARIKRNTKIRQAVKHSPEDGTAAAIVGDIASELIDPAAMLFGAKAITAGPAFVRALKMSALGSGYEAVAASLDQQVESGEITSPQEIMNRAIIGGVAVPVIDRALTWAGKAYGKGKANKALKEFEDLTSENMSKGLNLQVAREKAADTLGLDESYVEEIVQVAGRKMRVRAPLPDSPIDNIGLSKRLSKLVSDSFVGKAGRATKRILEDTLGVYSTRVRKISRPVWRQGVRMEYNIKVRTHEALTEIDDLVQGVRNLKGKEAEEWKHIVSNSDRKGRESFLSKPGREKMKAGYQKWVKIREALYAEAKAAGHKIGEVDDFWPRAVRDHEGMAKELGFDTANKLERALRVAQNKKGSRLTDVERADVINKIVRFGRINEGATRSSGMKSRTVDVVPKQWLKYYHDPADSLELYIQTTIHNLEKRRFFGYGRSKIPRYNENLEHSIGSLIDKELQAKNITLDEAQELAKLLRSRFGGGETPSSPLIQDIKNIFYMATLANPVSAATQLGDFGIAAFVNGLGRTVRTAVGKYEVDMREIGLDLVSEEMASTRTTSRMLDRMLKSKIVMFKQVDRLGKNNIINGSLANYRSQVKTAKGEAKVRQKWKDAFTPKEMEVVIQDLKNKKVTNDIKYMLFSDLSDVQPISMSEMPVRYMNHPDGRILYMLNSFTIKQMDILRRSAYDKIKAGNKSGYTDLVRFGALFTLANMGADQIKSWMQGRDVDMSDQVVANIWKNFGTSEYIVGQLGEGKIDEAVLGTFLTPVSIGSNIVADVASDIANFGQQFKSLKHFPRVGKMAYQWFGGGIEEFEARQERQEQEKRNKERRGDRDSDRERR